MSNDLTTFEIADALETCDKEPIHIPGRVQAFGALLAFEQTTGTIAYVSENCDTILGKAADDILGKKAQDLLAPDIWHDIQNAAQLQSITRNRHLIGIRTVFGIDQAIHIFESDGWLVLEFEHATSEPVLSMQVLQQQSFVVEKIRACKTTKELLDLSVQLLRDITGFDRIVAYAFDGQGNGEVLAEARSISVDPMLGLRFPAWDIPAQARDAMMKLPLRIIADVDENEAKLRTDKSDRPPLDITLAEVRGVSPIHIQYLKNLGTRATMTLSVVVDDTLWGILSFHHRTPKRLTPRIRQLLHNFIPIFSLKLGQLRDQAALRLARRIDTLQATIQSDLEAETALKQILSAAAPLIFEAMNAQGIAILTGSQTASHGDVPGQAVLEALVKHAQEQPDFTLVIDSLTQTFPDLATDVGHIAGVLVKLYSNDRALFVFREERVQEIHWAGNPEKDIQVENGVPQLNPRASFNSFLQQVSGHCLPWNDSDLDLLKRLSPLLSAAERRAFLGDLSRQQNLMIEELNHRVRNILALVKSVSRQAAQRGGTLESYASSLQSRIHALAAAHDIGAGAARASVSITTILNAERLPHAGTDNTRFSIHGPEHYVVADLAPIFALVIHELVTNAAKYGALSNPEGQIAVDCIKTNDGLEIHWVETGGPHVVHPESYGFGTTLILQAVPYELGGTSSIDFDPGGVSVHIFLPDRLLDFNAEGAPDVTRSPLKPKEFAAKENYKDGLVMIVEDNFMIASDLRSDIQVVGFTNVEVISNVADAMTLIEREDVMLALLDVNLGQGETSEPIATKLVREAIPFMFVTGYGEHIGMGNNFKNVLCLTKPVSAVDLFAALEKLPLKAPKK